MLSCVQRGEVQTSAIGFASKQHNCIILFPRSSSVIDVARINIKPTRHRVLIRMTRQHANSRASFVVESERWFASENRNHIELQRQIKNQRKVFGDCEIVHHYGNWDLRDVVVDDQFAFG